MKLLLLLIAGLLLLTGCGPSEDEREIKQQLAEIKAALSQLSQPPQLPPSAVGEENKPADDKVIELPKLPDKPTAKDVKAYAGKLLKYWNETSINHHDYSAYDTAVDAIPPGYIIELAPYLDDYNFSKKIPDWLVDEDKERILKKLPEEPILLKCLPYMPYRYEDLRGPMLAMLRGKNKTRGRIPQAYVEMLVCDQEVCGQIKQLLFQNPDLYFFADAFAKRDGNQLIYDQVWKSYVLTKQQIPSDAIYARLADGKTDAIAVLIKDLVENKEPMCVCHNYTVLFPDFKGDWADLGQWLSKHQNQLVFNAKDQKYYLAK